MTDNQIEPTPAKVEMERGHRAREILENPLFAEAIAAWESEITQAWKTSPLRDAEGRENLRRMLEAAQQFQSFLTRTMETGNLAMEQVRRESTAQKAGRAVRRLFG